MLQYNTKPKVKQKNDFAKMFGVLLTSNYLQFKSTFVDFLFYALSSDIACVMYVLSCLLL